MERELKISKLALRLYETIFEGSVKPPYFADSSLKFLQDSGVLSQRDFKILKLRLCEGMLLVDIGRQLGISESRVCVLYKGIIVKLRKPSNKYILLKGCEEYQRKIKEDRLKVINDFSNGIPVYELKNLLEGFNEFNKLDESINYLISKGIHSSSEISISSLSGNSLSVSFCSRLMDFGVSIPIRGDTQC